MKFGIVILTFAVACMSCSRPFLSEKIAVILDTDANNELDDQHAIAYMLFSGDNFQVEGITVNRTDNGGDIYEQAQEAERVVKLCGLHETVSVTKGASGNYAEIKDQLDQPDFDGVEAVNLIITKSHRNSGEKLLLLPVGKLTNIALALKKDPAIIPKVKVLWLGSNYPEPGEYNQVNDESAVNAVLNSRVEFEIALVRYGKPSGTDAVRVTPHEIFEHMPGLGPDILQPVTGRHGGEFASFGDYSVNLFEHIDLYGDPPSRALFDMAAVAIAKNPAWAQPDTISAPVLVNGEWQENPDNERKIIIWEYFDRDAIMADFYDTMENYRLAE